MSKILLGRKLVLNKIIDVLKNSDSKCNLWLEQFFLTYDPIVSNIKSAISNGARIHILHDEFIPKDMQDTLSTSGVVLIPYKKTNDLPYTMHSKVFSWKNDNECKSLLHTATLKPQKHKTLDIGILLDSPTSDTIIKETVRTIEYINGIPLIPTVVKVTGNYFVNNPIISDFSLRDQVFKLIHDANHSITVFTKDFTDPIVTGKLVEKLRQGITVLIYAYKYDRTLVKWISKNGGMFYPTDELKRRLHLNCILLDEDKSQKLLVSSGHISPRAMGTSSHEAFCSREFGIVITHSNSISSIKLYIAKCLYL